jgi:molybdate transport system regulatory protein
MSVNNNQYKLKGRIWIEIGNKSFIGEGKALLLKKTAELGSLRKASAALGISYRQAWYSLNQMNKATENPVITLRHGGRDGGIAHLTQFGEEILTVFEKLQFEFGKFLQNEGSVLKLRAESPDLYD